MEGTAVFSFKSLHYRLIELLDVLINSDRGYPGRTHYVLNPLCPGCKKPLNVSVDPVIEFARDWRAYHIGCCRKPIALGKIMCNRR